MCWVYSNILNLPAKGGLHQDIPQCYKYHNGWCCQHNLVVQPLHSHMFAYATEYHLHNFYRKLTKTTTDSKTSTPAWKHTWHTQILVKSSKSQKRVVCRRFRITALHVFTDFQKRFLNTLTTSEQGSSSSFGPLHPELLIPPLMHNLILFRDPLPHVTEHVLQLFHCDHLGQACKNVFAKLFFFEMLVKYFLKKHSVYS